MSDLEIRFDAVSVPANTSATVTVYERVGGSGANTVTLSDGSTFDYDNTGSASLSDGTTSYTVSGFDASSGNTLIAVVEPDQTDVTATVSLTQPLEVGAPTEIAAPQRTLDISAKAAEVTGPQPITINAPQRTLSFGTPDVDVAFSSWVIDNAAIPADTDETATPRTLTLAFRVTSNTLTAALRPLKSDEGKVDTLPQDDGGFVAVDRANGGNTFKVTPPADRIPLRQSGDYHVARYEETLVSQDVGEWDVELELTRDADRTDTQSINEGLSGATFDWTFDQAFVRDTPAAWEFDTPNGAIVTSRVDAEFLGTGADGVERFEVTARLTFEQAHAFEAAYPRIAGTRVKAIPDASNVMVDDTGGDATVTVDAPGGSVVSDGEYVVSEWESTEINGAYQSVSFVLAVT